MARQNRRDIFDPNEVGCLHAFERTVRWAWLCGSEPVRVRWPLSSLRVVFSMFHGLTLLATTVRHFVAMSEPCFAAKKILIRRSPVRRRI